MQLILEQEIHRFSSYYFVWFFFHLTVIGSLKVTQVRFHNLVFVIDLGNTVMSMPSCIMILEPIFEACSDADDVIIF